MGWTPAFWAEVKNSGTPNKLPWSVIARAFCSSCAVLATSFFMRAAPSKREYWVWQWRWLKSHAGIRYYVVSVNGQKRRPGADQFNPNKLTFLFLSSSFFGHQLQPQFLTPQKKNESVILFWFSHLSLIDFFFFFFSSLKRRERWAATAHFWKGLAHKCIFED